MLNKTRTSKIDIDIIAKREKSKNNARKAGLLGLFLGPWISKTLVEFTNNIFELIIKISP